MSLLLLAGASPSAPPPPPGPAAPVVELGLGGSFLAQVLAEPTFKCWPMSRLADGISVAQLASTGVPPLGWSSGDSLAIVGSPLVDQGSDLPEGGMAIRLNGSSQYLASVYDETAAPSDIGPQTYECVVTIHTLPSVGQEPAVIGGSTDFAVTCTSSGTLRGWYNGVAVVESAAVPLDTPLHIVFRRNDAAPDVVRLWVNTVMVSATPTNATLTRGHLHLGKHWANPHYLEATYSVAGIYPRSFIGVNVEAHFAATRWTDITAEGDVGHGPLIIERGIRDDSPIARVAATGTCEFTLNNGPTNSAGLVGYYSPGHPDQRPGVGEGTPVRVTIFGTVVFQGRIAEIVPTPGLTGELTSTLLATDILDDAARFRLNQLPTLQDVRSDEIFRELVGRLPNPPNGLVVEPGAEIIPVALANSEDATTTALEEFVRVAHSEWGRIYCSRIGGLVHEATDSRASQPLAATLTESQLDHQNGMTVAAVARRDRLNRIELTTHQGVIDATNPTRVVFALTSPQAIGAGETRAFVGRYRIDDVPDTVTRIGVINPLPPVPGLDYRGNTLADGSGTDITSSLQVIAAYGANGVSYRITNTGGSPGFLTHLQARGTGVFDRTLLVVVEDPVAQKFGVNALPIDQPYNPDTALADAIGARELVKAQAAAARVKTITTTVFPGDPDLPSDLLAWDVSTRLALVPETVTAAGGQYHIQGIRIEIPQPGHPPIWQAWLDLAEEIV